MSQWGFLEFFRIWKKPQNFFKWHSLWNLRVKFVHCRMFQVVHWWDKAQLCWQYVSFAIFCFINFDALGVFEFGEDIFDSFSEPLLDGFVVAAFQTVVIGIFEDSSEHEGPSDPFNTVGCIVYFPSGNLCVDMVLKLFLERGLDGERVVQKLPVKILLWRLAINDRHSLVIELRPACSSYHL